MSLISRLFAPPRPLVAVEIAARHVSALRLGGGRPALVEAHAVEALPEGAVVPSLAAMNLADAPVVTDAVRRVLAAVGGARHVALVVPDSVAKVSLVRFDQVPAREGDLDAMLRWNIRKSLPFKAEAAQVSWTAGAGDGASGREYLVAASRRDVIEEYERACSAAGAHPGIVDLATFNLINLQAASGAGGDWLLVHVAADYVSLAIARAGHVIFFRHRGADGDESLADLVHQTAMYYEDRLAGKGFGRVVVAGATSGPAGAAGADGVRRALAERLSAEVATLDPRVAAPLSDRVGASPDLLDRLAPLVGVLIREPAA
jgi:type IV pilus assembly protein PilM